MAQEGAQRGWLSWRGPDQNGTSAETGLIDSWDVDGEETLWTFDLRGRGTPVIGNGRVFFLGYEGEGADLEEMIVCLDERDGSKLWEIRWSDYLTDVIYDRYAIGSPSIDPETGNVFFMTSAGRIVAVTRDGEELWQHSMSEEYGRLTFPNGRTGAPAIDDERVIIHNITSHWGPLGPARDRFHCFDKHTGELLWEATPGEGPKDSSFSMPVLAWENGRRMLYAGTGCGNMACIDARTGEVVWRFKMATGGVNSSALLYKDKLIAIHGKENVDSSEIGRMMSIQRGTLPGADQKGVLVLDPSLEQWRNNRVAFTSSPTLVGNRVYQTTLQGDLCCIDADTGKIIWHEKLAPDQIHASPLAADGKLYVPMNNGSFHIVRPTDEGPKVLSSTQLEGNCLGAPALAGGRFYVHTTAKLYCFGKPSESPVWPTTKHSEELGDAHRLRIVPADTMVRAGEAIPIRVDVLDGNGAVIASGVDGEWGAVPPFDLKIADGMLRVSPTSPLGTGMVTVSAAGLSTKARLRVVPVEAYNQDFDRVELKPHPADADVSFAFPPAHWLGSKLKWEVRQLDDGNKVLAKTLDRALFQRAMGFIGHPDASDYSMQVDIMSDGNRRTMSTAGLVNQRYLIQLKGNYQEIEISSNVERIKETVPFKWKAGTWYTLKTRVDIAPDGSGVIRAKAWKREEAEPATWNIEVPHRNAHTHGSPGVFGFAPQSRFHVYLDNLSITSNDA